MAEEKVEKKLPFSLLILVLLYGLFGLLVFLGGALLLFKHPAIGIYALVMGLAMIYVGYGLYNFNKTAWILAVILGFIWVLFDLVRLAVGAIHIGQALISLAIDVAILAILLYYSNLYGVSISLSKPAPSPASASVVDTKSMRFFRRLVR